MFPTLQVTLILVQVASKHTKIKPSLHYDTDHLLNLLYLQGGTARCGVSQCCTCLKYVTHSSIMCSWEATWRPLILSLDPPPDLSDLRVQVCLSLRSSFLADFSKLTEGHPPGIWVSR